MFDNLINLKGPPSQEFRGPYGILVVHDQHSPNAYQFKLIDRSDVQIFHIDEEFYFRLHKVFTYVAQEVMYDAMSDFTFRRVLTRVRELMSQYCPTEFNGVARGEKITYEFREAVFQTVTTPITI